MGFEKEIFSIFNVLFSDSYREQQYVDPAPIMSVGEPQKIAKCLDTFNPLWEIQMKILTLVSACPYPTHWFLRPIGEWINWWRILRSFPLTICNAAFKMNKINTLNRLIIMHIIFCLTKSIEILHYIYYLSFKP